MLTQSNRVVFLPYILPFYMLPYVFLLILFFIKRFTNFQKRLIYGFLEILQFFQYTKIYEAIENVSIALFYRFCVVAALITMRLLILDVLCGDQSLISIFDFHVKL